MTAETKTRCQQIAERAFHAFEWDGDVLDSSEWSVRNDGALWERTVTLRTPSAGRESAVFCVEFELPSLRPFAYWRP